jgi:hypothetical protein
MSFELSRALGELGKARLRLGRPDEAELSLLEAFEILDGRYPHLARRSQVALDLARVYRALGRPEEEARFAAVDPRIPSMMER